MVIFWLYTQRVHEYMFKYHCHNCIMLFIQTIDYFVFNKKELSTTTVNKLKITLN